MYAGRKRRKPLQRTAKPPPVEVVKTNPSKRHRDRLNQELERLASLLPFPEEVTSSLDKLSILRLSVSYLRAKSFFHDTETCSHQPISCNITGVPKNAYAFQEIGRGRRKPCKNLDTKKVALKTSGSKGDAAEYRRHGNQRAMGPADGIMPEGELLLQALNGFVLVVTAEGLIFYSSHTIQEYLGFNQTDVMHQSVFELIHTEDQQEFRRNLHWALNPPPSPEDNQPPEGEKVANSSIMTYKPDQIPPENSVFLERSFVCRFRCLLDNSSGFLALNIQGRLKFLHGQNQRCDDVSMVPCQPALFAISTPLQSPSILEIRTKNMIFRTKHKLDFTPMACDAKGKVVLGYTETELRMRGTGYQFIHAADMVYCAENHVRMMKTGESGLTVFRLLTKENSWKWVQANARLVYKNGKPDYIIATQRPLVEEEAGDHLRKRSMHLPFTFATGEAVLYQISYPFLGFPDQVQKKGKSKARKSSESHGSRANQDCVDPKSLLGAMMRQDETVYVSLPATTPKHSFGNDLSNLLGDASWPSRGENSCTSGSTNGIGPVPELAGLGDEDPLLCTLDSLDTLSIGGDDNCSNHDLFDALESLGLNAEDLELLLLDERMMRVETDSECVPSLNDLLTNNEILSYVHNSFVNRLDQENAGDQPAYPSANPAQTSSATGVQKQQTQCASQSPEQTQPQFILQLSQQMQQYSIAQKQQNGYSRNQMVHTSQCLVVNKPSDHPTLHRYCPSWREQVIEAEGITPCKAGPPRNGQPEVAHWIRSNEMDLQASKHTLLPVIQEPQQHHKKDTHLTEDRNQPTHLSVQHSRLPQADQVETQLSETRIAPWDPLQHKNSHNLLTNGLCNHSSLNGTILESNMWSVSDNRLNSEPEHPPAIPTRTGVSSDRQGPSYQPQLYSALAPNGGVSTIHFYLNGLSNMEFMDTVGPPEPNTQFTSSDPLLYPMDSEKQSFPVLPDAHCSFQKSSMGHFVGVGGQVETPVCSYGMYPSLVVDGPRNKPGNGCVGSSPLPGFPGPSHMPNGNHTAPTEEPPSHQEGLPSFSNLYSSGFYL